MRFNLIYLGNMKYFLVAFSLLILAGCGGLLIPSNKDVTIKSVPDEATVSINGINSATTPVVVRLDNKSSHVITVSKSGYDSVSCALNTTVQEYIVALDIIGSLIPVMALRT